MRKIFCAICLFFLLSPNVSFSQATNQEYPQITDAQLPAWIPDDIEIRAQMVKIFNAAIELYNIKGYGYAISKAWIDKKTVWVRLERGTLSADIQIGEFEQIESVQVINSMLKVRYKLHNKGSFAWKEFTFGSLAGIAASVLVFWVAKR